MLKMFRRRVTKYLKKLLQKKFISNKMMRYMQSYYIIYNMYIYNKKGIGDIFDVLEIVSKESEMYLSHSNTLRRRFLNLHIKRMLYYGLDDTFFKLDDT